MSAFRTAILRFTAPVSTVSTVRPLSTSVVRPSIVDKAKQMADTASKTAGNVLLKGINATEKVSEEVGVTSQKTAKNAENLKHKTAETAKDMQNTSGDEIVGKAQGTANEYSGKAKGTANEYAGKAKGTANEFAGKAKRAANETVQEVENTAGFASDKAKSKVNKIEGSNDRIGRPGY